MSVKQPFGGIGGTDYDRLGGVSLQKIYEAGAAAQRGTLTVTDVERLAKAGVQINIGDIVGRLVPDSAPTPPTELWGGDELTRALLERYKRNKRARDRGFEGHLSSFRFLATEHGDRIHVYVAPTDGRDPVVLVDDKAIFPSDALMSAIYLMEKCK